MALKIGELYAVLGLDSKDFYKDLDKSEGKLEGLSKTFFQAITAGKRFEQSIDKQRSTVQALEKMLTRQNSAVEDNQKKVNNANATLEEAKKKQEELAVEVGTTSKKYLDQEKAVMRAEKELANANDDLKAAQGTQKGLEKQLAKTSEELKKQASNWNKVAASMGATGKYMDETGKKLTKTVTTPLVAMGTAALYAGIEFESAFAGVEKTVDGTDAQMARIKTGIREMAKEIPTGTTELSALAEAAGQLGIKTPNVLGFTRVMADMKETTNLGEEGASQMAKFANITGMAQANFDRLGSTIVELGNNFATTEADIMAMGMRLAGAGKQIGLSEADIMGWAAALSSVGIEAEAGGSAFSKVFSQMQLATETGGKKLDNFAKVAGMSAAQFAQAFRNDASAAVNTFIQGLSSGGDSAIKVLNDIGITELRMTDALLRASGAGDTFTGAIASANKAWKENNALANEADKRYKTTASRMKTLGNQAKDVGIGLSEFMIPHLESAMGAAGDLIGYFNGLGDSQKSAVVSMAAFAAASGPVTSVLGKVTGGIGKAIAGFRGFGAAAQTAGGGIKGLMAGMTGVMSPMGWLALAAGIVVAGAAIVDYASGAKAAREATEKLKKSTDDWANTQAKTIFDSGNDPFARFALDRSLFGSVVERTKKDTKELDTAGKTIERLLAKQQKLLEKNPEGNLNEKDQGNLNTAAVRRVELAFDVVVPNAGEGFEAIETSVQAEVDRLNAIWEAGGRKGEKPAINAEVYGDAMNAASQGQLQNMNQLNAAYSTQYAEIQKVNNEGARTAALAELDAEYAAKRTESIEAYRKVMADLAGKALDTSTVKKGADDFDRLYEALKGGKDPISLAALFEGDGKIDEGQLASYIALLTQMETLKKAGATDEEMKIAFPEFDGDTEKLETMLGHLEKFKGEEGALGSLWGAIGESIPAEIERIFGDVNASTTEVTLGDDVVLPEIPGFVGLVEKAKKGEKIDWENGDNMAVMEAVISEIQEIPEDKRTLSQKALLDVALNADSYENGALEAVFETYLAQNPLDPVKVAIEFEPPKRNELDENRANTLTNAGSGLLTNSVYEATVNFNMAVKDGTGYADGFLEMMLANNDMEAIALDIPVQMGILADPHGGTEEEKSAVKKAAEDRLKEYQKLLTTVASDKSGFGTVGTDVADGIVSGMADFNWATSATNVSAAIETALRTALDSNSPAKEMEPVGEDTSAGVGVGMEGYSFAGNATKVAANVNSKLASANTAKNSAYKARGSYVSSTIAAGMLAFDWTSTAGSLVDRILAAIQSAAGGTRGFEIPVSADAGKAASMFESAFKMSDEMAAFARAMEADTRIAAPGSARQHSNTPTVRVDIDYSLLAAELADAIAGRPVSFTVNGRELSQTLVNDNSRTLTERDNRVKAGYGGR